MGFLFNPGILWLSILTSTATWALLFWVNWDWLKEGGHKRIFTVLAGVHLFRFIGLVALSPTHVDPALGMSINYLLAVGFGDWAANVLAIIAIIAVQKEWRAATLWSWAFIIVGTLDTLNAGPNFALAIKDQNMVGAMGWLILTIYVPVIALTEGLIIWQLAKRSFGRSSVTRLQAAE